MLKLSSSRLVPGMVLVEDAVSFNGTVIVKKGVVLTDKNISSIAFHGINNVLIETSSDRQQPTPVVQTPSKPVNEVGHISKTTALKNTKEFLQYKAKFEETTHIFSNSLNDIIKRNGEVDTGALLSQLTSLYSDIPKGSSVFDIIHSMRDYDDSTYVHSINVTLVTLMFAKWLDLPEEDVEILSIGALLHDIGKLYIPENIIKKDGRLTDTEFEVIKSHPIHGYKLVADTDLNVHVKNIILMHHEKCDGSGYPFGLKGDKIDRFAKIVAIADIYDATTSARVYRGPLSPFEVVDIFISEGFQKFEAKYIMVFLQKIAETYLDQDVILSTGEQGTVVFINSNSLSRPIVRVGEKFYDLSKEKDISILKIV